MGWPVTAETCSQISLNCNYCILFDVCCVLTVHNILYEISVVGLTETSHWPLSRKTDLHSETKGFRPIQWTLSNISITGRIKGVVWFCTPQSSHEVWGGVKGEGY